MKEFVAYIVKNLVDCRDRVSIRETEGAQTLIIELSVEKSDIGKVIGKRGRTIRAIRTLLTSVASRHGVRVNLEILEEGRPIATDAEDVALETPEKVEEPASQDHAPVEESDPVDHTPQTYADDPPMLGESEAADQAPLEDELSTVH